MDLATAIREGSTKRGPARGHFFRVTCAVDGIETVGSCALGAAFEALTGRSKAGTYEYISKTLAAAFPALTRAEARCPMAGDCAVDGTAPLFDLIPHLNDDHGWTRERIADWVEAVTR